MIGIQGRKTQNEKQFPGCLGRMVNLFDMGNGMTGNKLLTDKPHNYGSPLSRSCSDVASTLSAHYGDQIGGQMAVSELRRSSSNKRASGTPMKALIAHEMSKEVDSRRSPPNLVAKLMGLETLPHQQHSPTTERCHSKAYSSRSLSQSEEQSGYRDVYEIWQQSEGTNVRDNSPQKGRRNERKIDNGNDKKMALVRQKFIEAKRLATDEKSRQSKEFQDALEVLSSNRDLFLKFLQEPHSLFSQHLYDMQSVPSPPETNHITVLRPSKSVDNDKFLGSWKTGDKQSRRPINSEYSPSFSDQRFEEYPAQRTRIVVLKPSPARTPSEEVVAPPFYEPGDELVRESSEVAEQMNTMGHRRDETVLSSVFSNGYVGDDSSFNKSDNDYAVGNLSDSEIMSPVSRHSWDYINRSSSPFSSSSSFSRASCSPESSVCREAKKRLSERWAMMASNGNVSEQKETRQSSSTLGEMLALSDTNKIVKPEEQEPRGSTSSAVRYSTEENGVVDSPKGLLRSRSLPVSSTVYATEPNGKTEISKELKRAKSSKSSLKGKVSSLFFSRNKKSSKEKSGPSHSKDEWQSAIPETPGVSMPSPAKSVDNASQSSNNIDLEDCSSPVLPGSSGKTVPTLIKEGVISVPKALMSGNISENQDQPSPNSVLEPPFEEDDSTGPELSTKTRPNFREGSPKSNLIDKSPPIESIARTLSWDESCIETTTSYTSKPLSTSSNTDEEQDWPLLIQTLLSEAGLDGNTQLDSLPTKWHSLESPLDPTFRTKFANLNDKEVLHEAQRRQTRSTRKLMFDCLNATLTQYTSNMTPKPGPGPTLYDHAWGQMKEWLFNEAGLACEDGGDGGSLAVEVLVRKEVVGRGWSDGMRVELDNLGREIEEKLLAELVEDAVVHLTWCV